MNIKAQLIAPLALLAALASNASAQIVYRETFQNTTAGNADLNTVGWFANSSIPSPAGTDYRYTGSTWISSGTGAGSFSTTPNINSRSNNTPGGTSQGTQTADTVSTGFVFMNGFDVAATSALFATDEFFAGGSVTTANISSMSATRSFSRTATSAPSVRIGTTWYVYIDPTVANRTPANTGNQIATNPASTWGSAVFSSANWGQILGLTSTINSGSTSAMSIGATAILPTNSAIVGIGFYQTFAAASNGSMRYDNIEVSVIPEPSAFAAIAGLGVLGLATSRRRRRA